MGWTALGREPAPGDVGAVDRLGRSFGVVADRAEDVLTRLRGVDDGTSAVWRGTAADDFRRLVARVGPGLTTMSVSYRSAQHAAATYARNLGDAQDVARRAEADAERASADRDAADARRRTAATDAARHAAARRAAQLGIAEAQALRLTTAVIADPGYAATVADYERQMRVRHSRAQAAEAEARHRERAEQDAVHAADQRLDRARRLGDDAADEHGRAKDAFIRVLREAGDASGVRPDLVHRLWHDMQRSTFSLSGHHTLYDRSWNRFERRWSTDKNAKDHTSGKGHKDGKGHGHGSKVSVKATLTHDGWSDHAWGREGGGKGRFGSWSADTQAWGAEWDRSAGIGRLDDGSYGATAGVSGAAYAWRGEARGRLGNDRFGVEGKVHSQVGARGQAGVDIGFGKNKAKVSAGADAFAGVEAGGEAGVDVAGVKPTVSGHVQAGIGATAKADVGYSNGKLKIKGELGVALGLGVKGGGGVEIDVPKLARNLDDAGDAASGFVKKGIGSFHAPW